MINKFKTQKPTPKPPKTQRFRLKFKTFGQLWIILEEYGENTSNNQRKPKRCQSLCLGKRTDGYLGRNWQLVADEPVKFEK